MNLEYHDNLLFDNVHQDSLSFGMVSYCSVFRIYFVSSLFG